MNWNEVLFVAPVSWRNCIYNKFPMGMNVVVRVIKCNSVMYDAFYEQVVNVFGTKGITIKPQYNNLSSRNGPVQQPNHQQQQPNHQQQQPIISTQLVTQQPKLVSQQSPLVSQQQIQNIEQPNTNIQQREYVVQQPLPLALVPLSLLQQQIQQLQMQPEPEQETIGSAAQKQEQCLNSLANGNNLNTPQKMENNLNTLEIGVTSDSIVSGLLSPNMTRGYFKAMEWMHNNKLEKSEFICTSGKKMTLFESS